MQPTKSPTSGTVCCSQFFNFANLILFVRRVNQIVKLATVSFCLIYHYNALPGTECVQVMMNVAIHLLVMAGSVCITLKCFYRMRWFCFRSYSLCIIINMLVMNFGYRKLYD